MRGVDPRSDGELLVAARSDPAAFGVFYDRHLARVLAFFRARVRSPEAAFDLTAETFAGALGSVGRYTRRKEPAAAWLFAIARHKLSEAIRHGAIDDRARRALEMQPVDLDDEGLEIVGEACASGTALDLLDALPTEQRSAIWARHVDGRAYGEIALELRCSESVVRKRVSRGLATIRSEIGRRHGDE
jgi:RNA polymerase sigma-70 factor (ECF subfamily)